MKPKLKNYRVIKKIGQGGMGVVYAAEDVALGRLVALKVLAPFLVQDPEIMERFRSEARSQARLVHPNITMVYSFLEENEQAFLVLEFIDGETLESRINREGRIAAVETVAMFRKILGAIDYAHSKGVIHRDLKPGNIAFTSEGIVKIMDFGIALNTAEDGRLTRTGHVLGTPHYMAPEQILGQEVAPRTDIYALGITLFEMLTGRLPFESKSDFEIRMAQINHPPPFPTSFGFPDITPELEEVILKALAKAPEARFASAGEFLQVLEASVAREQLITVVKDLRLDKSTQILEVPRKPTPPPSELEIEEPPSPPPEAQVEAPPAPPPEPQIDEPPAPPPAAPEIEESPAPPLAEVQEFSVSPEPEQIEELPVMPLSELLREEPPAPPPEAQIDEPLAPPPAAPEIEESPAPPLAEVQEFSVSPPLEPIAELPVSPLSDLALEEPLVPAPSEQRLEAPVVPPPSELKRRKGKPAALPSRKQQSGEPAAMPVLEKPFVPPDVETGWFSRARLIFLPLALLPLLALFFFFRPYFLPGPPGTPKAMVSPQPGSTASEREAPPSREAAPAKLDKMAKDQPEKEKPVVMTALSPPEKKAEIPEKKEPKPIDLQKTIKDSLAANGFSNMGVLVDEKKGVVISGNVKNLVQKNKVIQLVNSMGLAVPVNYGKLKVEREVAVEKVKKKVEEERPRIARPEAPPRPSPPEAPRKPLPPRLDKGNIQF